MGPARVNKCLVMAVGLLLALVASGCASEFERRYDEAEQLRLEAADRGYEWIGTAALLEQAQAEAAAGKTDAALALVDDARFEADAALQQAEREAEAWQRRVVK